MEKNAQNLKILKKRLLSKQTLKPFNMKLRKAIPKTPFVSEEESNCEEEIKLALQGRIGNIS